MGRMLGVFDDADEIDRPDLNKCPDCGCFFASDNCTICGKPCPEEMRAGNRKPVKKKRRKSSDSRVVFVDWYHNWWVILIALVVFPYIGIVLLLTSPHKRSLKFGIAAVAIVYTLLTSYGVGRNVLGYFTGLFDKPVDTSLSKEEYMSVCAQVDTETFYRMAENYNDQYVLLELVIKDKITDSTAYYENKKYPEYYLCSDADGEFSVLVRDCVIDGASNFLDGETVTVYGEGEGNISLYDMEYNLHSAPCLNAAYIEIRE